VTSSFILETALRIELCSDLLGCRKVVFGAIEGNNRHPVPDGSGITRKETIGQIDCPFQNVSKDSPGKLLTGFGKSTAVDFLGIRPQSATPGRSEEITRFNIHSLALPAGHKREDESNDSGKGEFPVARKILGRLSVVGVNIFGNEVKEILKDGGELA
jgi:hypothetical protein